MELDGVDEEVVCLRELRLVKVSPAGERSVSCVERCPLEACTHVFSGRGPSGSLDQAARVARPFVLRFCGELISPLVTALDAELSVAEALSVLDAARLSSAPVVDDNLVLVGLVSTCELHAADAGDDVEVEDAMTTAVVAVSDHATVAEIARVMDEHDLDPVPVVNADGQLRGLVTAMDLVRWFRRHALPMHVATPERELGATR
jgi:CBS domain-containing protein